MKRLSHVNSVNERLSDLSEPVRLRMLRILESEELSVGEMAKVVQLPQSTVSRHLKLLAEGGWIVRRSEGTAGYYRLIMDDLPPGMQSLWQAVREQLGSSPELAEDNRRLNAVLAERRGDSLSFFGRVAGEWDDLRTNLFGRDFTAEALLTLLPSDWVVVDIGCGTGNVAELLGPCVERVVALDQSEPMLQAARKRLGDLSNVDFVHGAVESLPLESGSVDAVVCALVLHHVDAPVPALREMRRVLRTDRGGGVVLVVDMYEHDRVEYRHTMGHSHLGFSEERTVSMLEQAGFTGVSVRSIRSDPEGKGPGLFAASARVSPDAPRTRSASG